MPYLHGAVWYTLSAISKLKAVAKTVRATISLNRAFAKPGVGRGLLFAGGDDERVPGDDDESDEEGGGMGVTWS